jgi:pimeloyl-ACP methyl ester carboxylesterase
VKARAALGNPEGAARVFLRLAGGPDWREDTAQVAPWAADQADRAARVFFDVDFPSISSFEWNEKEAARISQPVLWIHGGESMMSVDTAKRLVPTWFPKSDFAVVPDATHMLPMHKPQPIAEAIGRFLPKHGL